MATAPGPSKPEKRRRQDRQFRIMFRPTGTLSRAAPLTTPIPDPPPRRKISRILGLTSTSTTLVEDLCSKLVEKSSHWALVVLKAPYDSQEPRTLVSADDSRIERVFELSRVPRNLMSNGVEVKGQEDEEVGLLEGWVRHREGNSERETGKERDRGIYAKGKAKWGMGKGREKEKEKEKEKVTGQGTKGKANRSGGSVADTRNTPDDSSEDDRHEDDAGFPEANERGEHLKMKVSERLTIDFAELQCEHLGGPLWEILTGIEARTKFSNTELKHEASRIWKRQQNYHVLDNNCQRFCILLAITIRAKNHSLLRVLHGETVKKQVKGMNLEGSKK